jgi:hypothetical protein
VFWLVPGLSRSIHSCDAERATCRVCEILSHLVATSCVQDPSVVHSLPWLLCGSSCRCEPPPRKRRAIICLGVYLPHQPLAGIWHPAILLLVTVLRGAALLPFHTRFLFVFGFRRRHLSFGLPRPRDRSSINGCARGQVDRAWGDDEEFGLGFGDGFGDEEEEGHMVTAESRATSCIPSTRVRSRPCRRFRRV